jgi:hypothetical protein
MAFLELAQDIPPKQNGPFLKRKSATLLGYLSNVNFRSALNILPWCRWGNAGA